MHETETFDEKFNFLESTLLNNFVFYNYIKFYMIKKHFYYFIFLITYL